MEYNPIKTGYPNLTQAQILAIDYRIHCLEQMREEEKVRAEKLNRLIDNRHIDSEVLHIKSLIWGLEELSFICPAQRIEWFKKIGFADARDKFNKEEMGRDKIMYILQTIQRGKLVRYPYESLETAQKQMRVLARIDPNNAFILVDVFTSAIVAVYSDEHAEVSAR